MRSNILEKYPKSEARVYVFWFNMLPGDSRDLVDRRVLNDRRVTNYYPNRVVGSWFADHVDGSGGIVWDALWGAQTRQSDRLAIPTGELGRPGRWLVSAVGHTNSSRRQLAISDVVRAECSREVDVRLRGRAVCWPWTRLIYAATAIGAREYSRSNPPSLSSQITGPDVPTGSERAIGVRNSSPRWGRASL